MQLKLIRLCLILMILGLINTLSFAQNSSYYPDASQSLTGEKLKNYEEALNILKSSFEQVCGDTFCEGDFSNLTSLGITCSIDSKSETLVACSWSFAGVAGEVNSATGTVDTTHQMLKTCSIDVARVQLSDFTRSVRSRAGRSVDGNALNLTLSGKKSSLYDQLSDCL